MYVEVTKQHIEKATRLFGQGGQLPRCCPLALALREHFRKQGKAADVYVGQLIQLEGEDVYAAHTRRTRAFVRRFDAGLPVEPARFRLQFKSMAAGIPPEAGRTADPPLRRM